MLHEQMSYHIITKYTRAGDNCRETLRKPIVNGCESYFVMENLPAVFVHVSVFCRIICNGTLNHKKDRRK